MIITYVEETDTGLKSVVFDGVEAEKVRDKIYVVRAEEDVTNGILSITAANEDSVIRLNNYTSENGVLNISYNLTGDVSKVDFTATSMDGNHTENYTLYIIRKNTGAKSVFVNNTELTKTDDGYVYEVNAEATIADVRVIAESEVSKVQIGGNAQVFGEDKRTITLTGDTTIVPVKIYSYPYGENDAVTENVKIIRRDISLSLLTVSVKSDSPAAGRPPAPPPDCPAHNGHGEYILPC